MAINYNSTNPYLGTGKAMVNITELKNIKSYAEKLIYEIKLSTHDSISQARSVANGASREYGSEASVSSYANYVLTQCENLAVAKTAALNELEDLVNGIDKVISGYLSLEQELANWSFNP